MLTQRVELRVGGPMGVYHHAALSMGVGDYLGERRVAMYGLVGVGVDGAPADETPISPQIPLTGAVVWDVTDTVRARVEAEKQYNLRDARTSAEWGGGDALQLRAVLLLGERARPEEDSDSSYFVEGEFTKLADGQRVGMVFGVNRLSNPYRDIKD